MDVFAKIKQSYKNQFIGKKIMIVYIPLIIIPLLVLGIISYVIFTGTLEKITTKNFTDNSSLITTQIAGIFERMEICANSLVLDLNNVDAVQQIVDKDEQYDLLLRRKITIELDKALTFFPGIESAIFIDVNNNLYFPSSKSITLGRNFNDATDMLAKINDTYGKTNWFQIEKRNYLTTDPDAVILTLGKEVRSINTFEKIGTIILNIRENSLSDIYKNLGPVRGSRYFISDQKGNIVSSSIQPEILQPISNDKLKNWVSLGSNQVTTKKIEGQDVLLTKTDLPRFGWKLVGQVPLSELNNEVSVLTRWITIIGIICLVFGLVAAGLLSRLITNPIDRLKKEMLNIRNEQLDITFELGSNDEIGLLASGINKMVGRIRELIGNNNEAEKKKREYELALIQAQIKPHFLYNTLESVYALSEFGRNKEAQKMTKALADFYRAVLSKGKEKISIKEEIKSVIDYLEIQKIRYSDVFDFEIDISREILPYSILKLTIQPLVENAIYHGLKEKKGFGKITIKGYLDGDKICIKVIDDGVGMSSDKAKHLITMNTQIDQLKSFGISNIDERIKLFFGNEYGLTIASEPGRGVEATVAIPAKLLGGREDAESNDS